jgi:uncharacterized protein YkwD
MRIVVALALVAALPACGGSSGGSSGGTVGGGGAVVPPPTAAPPVPENNSFAALLNNARVANGAGTVVFDARLGRAAQGHANDMVTNDFFSHTGSDGSTVGQRATAQGYNYSLIGENIAQGQQSVPAVMTAWTNSPGHNANNINPAYEHFALGVAGSGSELTWVLVLGAEQ